LFSAQRAQGESALQVAELGHPQLCGVAHRESALEHGGDRQRQRRAARLHGQELQVGRWLCGVSFISIAIFFISTV
tara:strand:- start:283 stop:510 length:228 start_codon:yes stop_codon:yes gene_type:complete